MAIFPIVLVISAMPPMLRVPAGDLVRGREESPRKDETPRHRVHIDAFLIDETLVTRAAFARFVEETHYRTSAEKLGYGMVSVEGMADWKWDKVKGATWQRPFGDRTTAYAPRDDDPVTMVSWLDADAYCRWVGRRLPTEAEF